MKNILQSLLLFLILYPMQTLVAQDSTKVNQHLNFFLDCWDCDFTFVRQELEFVSFVRDPKLADVHILSSQSRTGSGGHKYYLNFIGLNDFEGNDFEYEYISEPSETDDQVRKGLLKLIQTGILQYYSISGYISQIEIDLQENEKKEATEIIDDPWNLWVFRLGAGGDFQKEESQNEYAVDLEVRIEKVTAEWKIRLDADYEISVENYYDDGERIVNDQNQSDAQLEYVKSLNPRWSAGAFAGYRSASYINVKHSLDGSLGGEYNIFPWDESNRKVFAIRYQIGMRTFNYNEITIYDKLNEILFFESLGVNLELVQPWGRVDLGLEGSHYFHDFSKNRLTLYSDLSVRLTRQLSVYGEFFGQIIHDQLYLPKGDASLEDVLLRRRKLQTAYEIGGELGIRFTFGSIYNNVVNERF